MPGDPPGLTIVVAAAAPPRFRTALTMALAHAALGGRARLFLDAAAVPLLLPPAISDGDAAHLRAGLPTLAALFAETLDAGIPVTLCQSGLALAGATAANFDPRIDYGGMVSLLQTLGQDRLIVA